MLVFRLRLGLGRCQALVDLQAMALPCHNANAGVRQLNAGTHRDDGPCLGQTDGMAKCYTFHLHADNHEKRC